MNTKLLKLALDSGLINYVDHETPRVYFICGHADIEEVEKFAELIVRECVEVVKWTPSQFPNDEYVKNIKEHFGVEE